MPSIVDRCRELLGWMRSGPASYPTAVPIPPSRVVGPSLPPDLAFDEAYFAVELNQIRLSSSRRWWVEVDPMVFTVSEFTYDGKATAVPHVVGSGMLQKYGQPIPGGFLFDNTMVAGLHPYKGGRISVTTILYEVPRTNHAQQLLSLVDVAAGLFAAATNLGAYLTVARVMLDGVEAVLGIDGARPIIGRRHELAPDLGDDLGSGYFALVDGQVDSHLLWVDDHRLVRRDEATGDLIDLSGLDYLLHSIRSVRRRTDLSQLAFGTTVRQAESLAISDASEGGWKRAKAMMLTAFAEIVDSPDLVRGHGDDLRAELGHRLKSLHEEAQASADMGAAVTDLGRSARMADVTSILDL